MRYSQKKLDIPQDDTTSLAGWLYTDLLLALTVVFLAAISFIPSQLENPRTSAKVNAQNSAANTVPQPDGSIIFSVRLSDQSTLNLKSKIDQFLSTINNSKAVVVRSIQIEGGFNSKTESEYDGTVTAMNFFKKLKNENPILFRDANTTISTSQLVPTSTIYLRILYGTSPS
jgi:biopolymer transport protein ExbD